MNMMRSAFLGTLLVVAATPAAAQSARTWSGFYVGGRVGYVSAPLNTKERVLFDKNLDGQFGDTVTTAAGANAFSPGFCNGAARGNAPGAGCRTNVDGLDYAVHAGGDVQFGSLVIGGLVEYGRSKAEESVSAFSTTPASYALTREMRGAVGARARIGVDVQGALPYVTAGIVRAKVRSTFATTNTANAFATTGDNKLTGYRVGGGVERRFGPVSLGLLYLYTNLKDDAFRVNVTRGTAPTSNPFVLTNPNGTQFRRSADRFKTHSAALTASFRF